MAYASRMRALPCLELGRAEQYCYGATAAVAGRTLGVTLGLQPAYAPSPRGVLIREATSVRVPSCRE